MSVSHCAMAAIGCTDCTADEGSVQTCRAVSCRTLTADEGLQGFNGALLLHLDSFMAPSARRSSNPVERPACRSAFPCLRGVRRQKALARWIQSRKTVMFTSTVCDCILMDDARNRAAVSSCMGLLSRQPRICEHACLGRGVL